MSPVTDRLVLVVHTLPPHLCPVLVFAMIKLLLMYSRGKDLSVFAAFFGRAAVADAHEPYARLL